MGWRQPTRTRTPTPTPTPTRTRTRTGEGKKISAGANFRNSFFPGNCAGSVVGRSVNGFYWFVISITNTGPLRSPTERTNHSWSRQSKHASVCQRAWAQTKKCHFRFFFSLRRSTIRFIFLDSWTSWLLRMSPGSGAMWGQCYETLLVRKLRLKWELCDFSSCNRNFSVVSWYF